MITLWVDPFPLEVTEEQQSLGREYARRKIPDGEQEIHVLSRLSKRQQAILPGYWGCDHHREIDENFAVPVFFNERNEVGRYLCLLYGPIAGGDDRELPYRGRVFLSAANYMPSLRCLTVAGVALPTLRLQVRLIQQDGSSQTMAQPLDSRMLFFFRDFRVNPDLPLRARLWFSGTLSP